MKARGSFLGMPVRDRGVEMRVVDAYRGEGSKLAESRVFLDLLHFLTQPGLAVLKRTRHTGRADPPGARISSAGRTTPADHPDMTRRARRGGSHTFASGVTMRAVVCKPDDP